MIIRVACLCAAAVLVAAAVPAEPRAQASGPGSAPPSESARRVHLLDVPYLPQGEALCGGAAAAMLMRYWGASGVYPDAFADLVDPKAGGIRGSDLAGALRGRGWQALPFRGDVALARTEMDKGRPLIVLIEDRPGVFHYVVVVALYENRVVVHDPARAPFRVMEETSFVRAWERSDFWTLLVLPGPNGEGRPGSRDAEPRSSGGSCDAIVDEGVRLAHAGETEGARRVLDLAGASCPQSPAPWRERAGLHALRGEWREAAADAREALRRDSRDVHAARTLATSLFLEGDTSGALDAWNVAGEPMIDLVNILGLERTRHSVAARVLALEPRTMLTASAMRRARRSAGELPAAAASRVSYRPGESGMTQVDAVIFERTLFPRGIAGLAGVGLKMLADRELAGWIASPSGGGELWTGSWRWWANRPRVALSFSAPAAGPVPGVWRVEAFDDRQTYGVSPLVTSERRRGASVQLSDWTTGEWRWIAGAGIDRWKPRGLSVSLVTGVERRAFDDRLATVARVGVLGGRVKSWTGAIGSQWQSRTTREGSVLLARAGLDATGDGAPFALWPGAGQGHAREVLLRAHSLLRDGVVAGGAYGRTLVHGGAEWRHWFRPGARFVHIAPAAFLDLARASRSDTGFDTRMHVDSGVGLRVAIPGTGVLRLDVARGLSDGHAAFSVGLTR